MPADDYDGNLRSRVGASRHVERAGRLWPDSAVAVPTVNDDCSWADAEIGRTQDKVAIATQSERGMKPPGRQHNPSGMARQESTTLLVCDIDCEESTLAIP